jgi:hypothetical protein
MISSATVKFPTITSVKPGSYDTAPIPRWSCSRTMPARSQRSTSPDNGAVTYDITSGASFSGTLVGSDTLVVSGGGDLDVASTCSGSVQVDDTSTLEFSAALQVRRHSLGPRRAPRGTIRFDGGPTGPITVVNPSDTVVAQRGSDSWIVSIRALHASRQCERALPGGLGDLWRRQQQSQWRRLYADSLLIAQTLVGNS